MAYPSRLALMAILILGVLASNACRSRRRAVDVSAVAPKVQVSLINIDEAYKNDPTLAYRITCGNAEWVPGKLAAANLIEFNVKGLKENQMCSLRVLELSPPADMKFLKDAGVIYGSDKFKISTTAVGQLIGSAVLSPLYQFENQGVSFGVPVHFNGDIPSDAAVLRASVNCDPSIPGASEKLADVNTKTKTGEFVFSGGVIAKRKYKCTSLFVSRGGSLVYMGDFPEVFTLSAGDKKTAKTVEIKAVDVTTPSGITVVTQGAGSCKDDEVFDIPTRTCVKK